MKIEKNIPLPKDRNRWVKLAKDMEVGDSVLLKNPAEALSLGLAVKRLFKGKVVTAKQACGGIRAWRKT
mgnify:CR=1 FL=1|tara:strand:- start:5017 stop:5223 length:207 start_codon:yes stop_codon:yes gene_type:complete